VACGADFTAGLGIQGPDGQQEAYCPHTLEVQPRADLAGPVTAHAGHLPE
jgi:hypothetical protein